MLGAATARFAAAASLLVVAGWACGGGPPSSPVERPAPAARAAAPTGPVVELGPVRAAPPPLDPSAAPTTPLGELRAGYLPVWSPAFDWAFPPEVCGSDWALDAVARAAGDADPAVLGDGVAAAALSVMRYEHLLSAAFADPHPGTQLCVAVATVDEARREALELLAAYLRAGARSGQAAEFPDEVRILAQGPRDVLAVACATDGGQARAGLEGAAPPDGAGGQAGAGLEGAAPPTGDGEQVRADDGPGASDDSGPGSPVVMAAYLLKLSRGLEDAVADVSYRVAGTSDRPAATCDELDVWADEWAGQAQQWQAEGLLWGAVDRTITVAELCDHPPPDGPDECPRDWQP